ncbi:hypothetical protein BH10BAC5_BH10BAC5_17670 [soil metagenome]
METQNVKVFDLNLSGDELLSAIDEHSRVMSTVISPEGDMLKVPTSLCNLLGYSRDELISKNIRDITHIDDIDAGSKVLSSLLTVETKSFEIEKRFLSKAGDIIWVHFCPTAIFDDDGKIKFFITYITNITSRKAGEDILKEANRSLETVVNERTIELVVANNKLHKSKKQFQNMLEKLPVGAYMCDADGLITFYNESAVDLWGRAPRLNDVIDKYCGSFKLYLDGKLIKHDECWMARAIKEQKGFNNEIIHVERPDGQMKVVIANANPIHDDNGVLIGAVNVLTDVTEKYNLETEFKKQQKELIDFVENASIGLHWVGPDGIIIWANKFELDSLGYTKEEYVGHNITKFHADKEKIQDILTRLTDNEILVNYEAPLICKDGTIKEVLINSSVYRENGEFIHTRCFTRDISEIKKIQKELQHSYDHLEEKVKERTKELKEVIEDLNTEINVRKHAETKLYTMNEQLSKAQTDLINFEKLASLGRFSSGVAHELKNPLANISALAQLLNQKEIDKKLKKHLKYILANAEIANRIINDLLKFASPYDALYKKENISELIRELCDLVKTRCEKNEIKLTCKTAKNIPEILVNKQKLNTAFLNFISNAIEAMPQGGKLVVQTSFDEDNKEVEISFADTGNGIPVNNMDKIMEPFFTTKAEGTGLGLSMAYYVIRAHSGNIKFESTINKGTKAILRLPVNDETKG